MAYKVPYSGISNKLGREEISEVLEALRQDSLSLGQMNAEFERSLAQMLEIKHVQTTSSCTTALYLAAQVLELREGDEVITTPQTFWVTTWPMLANKCNIKFADSASDL